MILTNTDSYQVSVGMLRIKHQVEVVFHPPHESEQQVKLTSVTRWQQQTQVPQGLCNL